MTYINNLIEDISSLAEGTLQEALDEYLKNEFIPGEKERSLAKLSYHAEKATDDEFNNFVLSNKDKIELVPPINLLEILKSRLNVTDVYKLAEIFAHYMDEDNPYRNNYTYILIKIIVDKARAE